MPEHMTEAKARRMRFLRTTQGTPTRELALMFDVGAECVRRVLRWETWRRVSEVGPGATAEEWAAATGQAPASTPAPATQGPDPARFLARLQAEGIPVGDAPTGEGLARLQAEATKLTRGDVLAGEFMKGENDAGHPGS